MPRADSDDRLQSNSIGQRRIGIVDELHHFLHLVQSDAFSRWLDFGLVVGYVELTKIDALEARGD